MRGLDHGYWIWEYPDYSRNYIVSADVARGDGADYSAFQVIDVESLTQVAEYKGQIGTKDYGNMLVSVATDYNNALLIVENANVGWAVLQQIIDRQYPNTFYSSADLQYVDVERQLTNKINRDEKKMIPGFTNSLHIHFISARYYGVRLVCLDKLSNCFHGFCIVVRYLEV